MEILGNYDTKTIQWVLTSKQLNLVSYQQRCWYPLHPGIRIGIQVISYQRRGKHFGSSEIIQILAIRNRFRMDLSCIQKFSAEINEIASFIQDKIVRKNSDLRLFLPKKGPKEQEKEETSNKDVNLLLLCPLNQCQAQASQPIYLNYPNYPELSEIDAKLAEIQPKLRLFLNVSEINHPKS